VSGFRAIAIVGFVLTIAFVYKMMIAAKISPSKVLKEVVPKCCSFGLDVRSGAFLSTYHGFGVFSYRLMMLSFLVLAFSGFLGPVLFGDHMTGILLTLHLLVAPLFAISAALLTLFWAPSHFFTASEFRQLTAMLRPKSEGDAANRRDVFRKSFFWLLSILSVFLVVPILVSMTAILSANGLNMMLEVHRYSAIIFTMFAAGHSFIMIEQLKISENNSPVSE